MRRSILFSATVVLAVACSTLPRGLPHEPLDSLPWSADADDQAVMQARAMFEQGQPKEALTAIEAVLERHPAHVDALRVRQDILRDRGRRGLLLHEVQEQLAANPEDPLANYLAGRLRRGDRARQQNFAAAVQAAPSSLWSWFGLAHSLRETDTARSLAIYAALYEASHRHP
ncbi:MAG: hypothetical protein KDC48_12945, partial [Planctomycetes bacterium]|nr:hypothetical protein [Planctomycetota bacterium]